VIADCVSAVAAALTVFIAAYAICVAKQQIAESRKIARETTATQLYNHCMQLSLAHPKLAEPALSGGLKALANDVEVGVCYIYFMASLLLSCEEILETTMNDSQWRASIKATLKGHAEYFRYRNGESPPLSEYYSDQLLSVINEIVNDPCYPSVPHAFRMANFRS
jgi:hypothetical protein